MGSATDACYNRLHAVVSDPSSMFFCSTSLIVGTAINCCDG
jgi:hypothetical protein